MSLTRKYVTRPVEIEAVKVTEANMAEVAEWCGGKILTEPYRGKNTKHIKVDVHKPQNPRQAKAFVGDWVLLRNGGYKVYLDQAFTASYDDGMGIPMANVDDVASVIFDEMVQAFAARRDSIKKPVKLETGSHTVVFDDPAPAVLTDVEEMDNETAEERQARVLREDISATPQ